MYKPMAPTTTVILIFVTLGLYGLYWIYITFEELKRQNGQGLGGMLALVLGIVTGGLIPLFMLVSELGNAFQKQGKQSTFSMIYPIIAIVIPLIGAIVYYHTAQTAMVTLSEGKA